jgi:hypothetical protein
MICPEMQKSAALVVLKRTEGSRNNCIIRWMTEYNTGMNLKKQKSIFTLVEVAAIFFIAAFLSSLLFPVINQIRSDAGKEAEMILPEFPPFNPSNGWPQWARIGFVPLSGLIAASAGAFSFWLVRR